MDLTEKLPIEAGPRVCFRRSQRPRAAFGRHSTESATEFRELFSRWIGIAFSSPGSTNGINHVARFDAQGFPERARRDNKRGFPGERYFKL